MKFINKYKSLNYNKRSKNKQISFIIIHYTALNSDVEAINHLCLKKNKVSSHFLISKIGKIYNLVDINKRAWHAGISSWMNYVDINSRSIGIELDNLGYGDTIKTYKNQQIIALIKLINFLNKKYGIKKSNILGHSDISPYRKIDPGEKFPWKKLGNLKLVYFPKKLSRIEASKIDDLLRNKLLKGNKNKALYMLSTIGYNIDLAKLYHYNFLKLIKAYQMHYRNKLITGLLDDETYLVIKSHYKDFLTQKHF